MSLHPVLYALGFLWSLPLTLVGFLLALPYGPRAARWTGGVLLIRVTWVIGFATTLGQTFGVVIFVKPDQPTERLLAHEREHTRQGFLWGPLFVLAYPVACLVAWLRGGHFYRDNWFEVAARRAAEGL